jgi:thioredoxin 1
MHPILDAIEKRFGNSVDLLRVNVDQYESVALVQHFRIMSVPTLMVFRRGRMLWRNSGMVEFETLVDVIRQFDKVEVY